MQIRSARWAYAGCLAACALAAGVLAPTVAQADVYSTGFEPPAFSPADINGQAGWSKINAGIDAKVFAHTPATDGLGLGAQSLRVSNAVTSLGLTDQTFAPDLTDAAGETGADPGNQPGGARQSRWEGSVTVAAFQPALQAGLAVDFSPARRDGQRMTDVRIEDTPQGLKATSFDVTDNGFGNAANFPTTEIASGLDRAVAHTLGFVIDFVDGQSNDVVRVYVDGALVHTAGSWEQYFRNDPEQAVKGNKVPTTNTLLVALRGPDVPASAGKGLFIDNVAMRSSTPVVTPPAVTPPPPKPPAPGVPTGTAGPDSITGGPGNDRIDGGGGNDRINGGAGNDVLLGGTGNDRIFGSTGADGLSGGSGKDRLAGGTGNDRISGGTGADLIFGGSGNDRTAGDSGNDRLFGHTGNDRMTGGSGNDHFSGGSGNDRIDGGSGNDLLSGNGGRDIIRGGPGNDRIKAKDGRRDTIYCGAGKDSVHADHGDRVAKDCERVRRN